MKNLKNTSMRKLRKEILVAIVFIIATTNLTYASDNNSLLYRISGNGLDQPSYIYGTIHMICADNFFITDAASDALTQSEVLVMELDMTDPQFMQKMQSLAIHPEMKNISDAMAEEEIEKFNNYLITRFGAGLTQIGMMKPFVIASMLVMTQINCESVESYENYFLTFAMQNEKPIIGLETIEFQAGIFDEIPYDLQVKELINMVNDPEKGLEEFAKLTNCYTNQDINCLYEVIKESESYFKDYEELLLTERNKNWIPILKEVMADQQSFIAVGAGHLPGQKGVLALLKKAGYTVEAVDN